ncbi:MAG TPA: head GIN domain-containing protein [Chitinophaga sp.]
MKTICLLASLFAISTISLTSCDVTGQNRVKGSGNVTKEERSVEAFKELSVRGSMDVYLTQGPSKAAVIEAEDNLIPLIEFEREGDKLIVREKRHTNIHATKPIRVYLTTPELENVGLAGSGNIKLENKFSNDSHMKVSVSGSGNFSGAINSPEVDANIAGSGNITVEGESRNLDVDIAGSGNFKGQQLLSEKAEVSIAGSGDANVHASVSLDAKIAGSGDVHYKGNPQINSKVAGSGSVRKD